MISSNNISSFENFMSEEYRLVSDTQKKKANTFLIGEKHVRECEILSGRFISYLASCTSLPVYVFDEGLLGEGFFYDPDGRIKRGRHIDPSLQNVFMGPWDDLEAWKEAEQNMEKNLKKRRNELEEIGIDICNKKEEIEKLCPGLLAAENRNELLDQLSEDTKELTKDKLKTLAVSELLEKMLKERLTQRRTFSLSEKVFVKTFPARTASMIKILKMIETWEKAGFQFYAVFLSGSRHVEETTPEPELNLDTLREQLRNHRALILIPKNIDSFE